MNTAKLLLVASIAAASFAASAATPEATPGPDQAPQSSLSRAQVQSQLADFKASGVNPWATSYNPNASFRPALTRAQVTAEFLASRDQVAAMTGEDSGSAYLTQVATRRHNVDANLAGQPTNTAN